MATATGGSHAGGNASSLSSRVTRASSRSKKMPFRATDTTGTLPF